MRKHSQYNNDERTQFFRIIYLTLYSKWSRKGFERVMCERWVGDWTKTTTYWPTVPPSLAALLSRSAGLLNRGPWGPSPLLRAGSYCLELQQTDSKLTEFPVAPGYFIVLHPPATCERLICTQFNPSTVKVIPWYLRPDAPVPWSTVGSEVNMLHSFKKIYYSLNVVSLFLMAYQSLWVI